MHCKAVGDGNAVLKYLAPYVYRVAISNRRLVRLDDYRGDLSTSQVTFQYRPAESRQYQEGTLSVEAFLQRFLQHVLPRGFVKVRYYGFLGSAKRKQLQALRQELQQTIPQQELAEGTDPAQPTASEPPKNTPVPEMWSSHDPSPYAGCQPMPFAMILLVFLTAQPNSMGLWKTLLTSPFWHVSLVSFSFNRNWLACIYTLAACKMKLATD